VPDTPALDPKRTALLTMDYQNGIVAQLPGSDALVGRAAAAVRSVRDRGGRIGWVRVAFNNTDLAAIPEHSVFAAMATRQRQPDLHADAPATQIDSRLDPRLGDITVRKTRIGAFSTTDLHQQLRAHAITTVVLAGISTSGVVLTTVREAIDLDYRIIVLRDACADRDPYVHGFLTENLFPAQSYVTTVDALWA